jgi:predicted DNA-binding transcriptional regulator AlpA
MTTFISWKTLSKMQPYSRQHWKRLEDEGKVPKRVRLGRHRVAWVLEDITDWQAEMISKRDTASP